MLNHLCIPFILKPLIIDNILSNELNNSLIYSVYPDIPICDNWSLHREFVIKRQEYLQNLDNLSNGFRKFGYN